MPRVNRRPLGLDQGPTRPLFTARACAYQVTHRLLRVGEVVALTAMGRILAVDRRAVLVAHRTW